ncbi:2-hydroxyacid dehydrogenase [Roseivivax sediminis]|uniref:Lactate dehydrogenase n=1 Tax=Roseivivax sediminis TaxID=936889 RepID=A0A1I2CV58_9RHOB|nr:2-hydroxyacid dehydrogenase [Roseivivax sediminis]SFE71683.1 Lactate dehydrogenase [Roseivivax sediminis]
MRIVFHGTNAAAFAPGIEDMLDGDHDIRVLSPTVDQPGEAEALSNADVVVGVRYRAGDPPLSARLYQLPAAGYDGIDMDALPDGCTVCNAFGHEAAIAEWTFAVLLARHVPLADADARLRKGDWHYWAGTGAPRTELGSRSIGIVGHGHIGKAVADRALAFGMAVHVVNRSPVEEPRYAGAATLDRLDEVAGEVDILVNTLPLTDGTRSLIDVGTLSAMKDGAIVVNVGRGPVVDEDALWEAVKDGRLTAILDTWYTYPSEETPDPLPSRHPFHELSNVTLSPHMSGWTEGTIARRRAAVAENINRLAAGKPLLDVVRP